MADTGSDPQRRRRSKGKNKNLWMPSWPEGAGSTGHVVLMGLCCRADPHGRCEAPLSWLADFAGVTVQTARMAVNRLIDGKALRMEKRFRDGDGMFDTNVYVLALHCEDVRDLFERFQRVATDSALPEINKGQISGNEESDGPVQTSNSGPYKDTRAGARASKSFILHSLPLDHGLDDENLAEQVAQALAVCGRGTAGVDTQGLVDSLAYNIPRALEKGFSFEKDILPCIRYYTRIERPKPLNRFDVTFRVDLPEWRAVRLRRIAKPKSDDGRERQPMRQSRSGNETFSPMNLLDRAIQKRENQTDEQRRAERIAALRQRVGAFDSGEESKLRSLTFELPAARRDLHGEDLTAALRPIIQEYRLELEKLLASVSKGDGSNGPSS